MKKMKVLFLVVIICILFSGCELFGAKGEVYVTVDNQTGSLFTVKFTDPFASQGSYPNEYSNYDRTESYSGYTWYVYKVPAGDYDVYIEWTMGGFDNGRDSISLDPGSVGNSWAAVYPDSGGNVWAETGGGIFDPGLYHNN